MGRLYVDNSLIIEDVITERNFFLYFLEGRSPNGYRQGDNREIAEALGAVSEGRSWLHVLYGDNDHLGQILTGLREELINFYYTYCRINTHSWKIKEVNKTMEATEVMDLRVALMAQRKRPRIGTSVVNLEISNEEDTDSGRLELCCKKRVDHVGTFVIMITTSLSANLQTAACESSLVPTHSNSPPPSIPPFPMPPPRELPIGKSGESAPSHKNLNYDELQDIVGK
ncbi:hypothetical protein PVK06_001181 [Gossypium arboreum]|uniref:Uncharacterized protein n=1 Tax=Gossypium arboreum TaxID=29729 RepID=A0ABR0R1E6_GOSAR|nr:hypothetical protein PVK06_001181 [Gossypium arboreum]